MSKLLGLLIFDHLNDIVYIKCNQNFIHHVQKLAISQGLIRPTGLITEPTETLEKDGCYAEGEQATEGKLLEEENISKYSQKYLDKSVIIQLFSPLVASHRIMKSQFKNAYDSISCEDGTKLIFQEHSSHLFLCIGTYSESYLNRFTNVAIRMSQLILGLCISILKTNKEKVRTLDCLLNAWIELYSSDQSFLVEAIERLIVNPDISSTAVYNLASIVDSLTEQKGVGSGHGLFFVKNKLLALYSSKNAEEILEPDILSLNLLLKANTLKDDNSLYLNTAFCEGVASPVLMEEVDFGETEDDDDPEDKEEDPPTPADDFDFSNTNVSEYVLFLQTKSSPLAPHVVYLYSVTSELSLVVVTQVNRSLLSGQLVEMFRVLEDLKNEEITVKQIPLTEIIENSLRNSQDFMKWIPKSSYSRIKKCLFQLCHKWEFIKKNDLEEWLRSSSESVLPSRLEASLNSFVSTLKTTWNIACLDVASPTVLKAVEKSSLKANEKMSKFFASPEPEECIRNISVGARSIISMSKYLEEFPGLIHFLYIDRATHQLTAPPLWTEKTLQDTASYDSSESMRGVRDLTAAKIWDMVGFARDHLARGHSSIIWKDKTFSYSYFLWFEDQGGNPLKQVALNKDLLKLLPQPGILCGDFYKAYAAKSLPNNSMSCIRGFELFCVHIGLATSPCILEQTRRLAASIWEITGPSSINPLDLL